MVDNFIHMKEVTKNDLKEFLKKQKYVQIGKNKIKIGELKK